MIPIMTSLQNKYETVAGMQQLIESHDRTKLGSSEPFEWHG